MIRNYLKIAFRNLVKGKFISFINLFGLTIGLACCLLILTYILNELSFDKYNKNADDIYRVTRLFRNPQTGATNLNLSTISPPFGPFLQNDFKDIKKMTRLLDNSPAPLKAGEKMFNEQNVFYADENLFDVFNVNVLRGDPSKALSIPFSVMLTEEMAKKYFGNEDPMDKTIRMYNQFDLKVSGIYKAFPSNAHIHPGMMISFNTLKDTAIYGEENLRSNWGNNSFFTYLLMPGNFQPEKMIAQFPAFIDRNMPTANNFKQSQGTELGLQKLTDIHLRSHTDYEAEENGDIKRVYIFSAIALFILLIACINYMNLSTARSALRAREIGIRKTVGAQRKEIIWQFLSESVLTAWIAMIFAIGLTWLMLPFLNKLSGQELSMNILFNWKILTAIFIIPFVVGLISGIYPALFMSSFRPVKVLKGLFNAGGSNISFRKALVTVQFAISIILIISTVVVFKQLRYMQDKSLGFNRDRILTMPYNGELNDKYDAFRNELIASSDVKNVTRSSRIPTGRLLDAMGTSVNNGDSLVPANVDIKYLAADQEFISTYGVKTVAGRDFSREFSTDTSAFLINEAAVKVLGIKSNADAVGKDIAYGSRKGKIIGVINDFHFESMHQAILPLIVVIPRSANNYNRISLKIAGNNISSALAKTEAVWKKFLPNAPYEYTFMDENFENLYESEQKQSSIFTVFAFIAIFIACLGLFGLSAFSITQRIKEIGIRKVLGATIPNIVGLLSKDFLKLVAISALIAFPIAWYAMNSWLQDFAYRTNISWWIFIIAGIIAAAIALFTISFQAIKAAIANPVKNLRTE
ncbi:MAG TPA: FtsX-like permease family protein [Ferruginibacter sp.]|nr:FtsX-like permease family protein [Ferruginibacter sp.]